MDIQAIINEWKTDCVINKLKLENEGVNINILHCKYMEFMVKENLKLAQLRTEYNQLLKDKFIFYTEGAKTIKDIQRAPRGAIPKTEVEKYYLLADDDVIKVSLNISLQLEKVKFLDSIINQITNRTYTIKALVDYQKFINGC